MAFIQVESLSSQHIEELWRMYQNEWWSRHRSLPDTRTMLQHTDLSVAFVDEETGTLAGFCRILTDSIFKAVIMDVIVAPPYRKRGLGAKLMEAAVNHPALRKVESIDLWCLEEMVPFYERWGFTHRLGEIRLMRRDHARSTPKGQ